ncbi:pentachlorophenol monooxygenase/3-(3-hydroxy-phenyl)propionate hydroxylase [Amycolatopsis marina]|uniref:Pentachlorophenol monooxygenase/3-(3-hydroxy-phenyl)propionate hydroxylase n=1 Tax=Amycolatopsis marina TaxID=490629 RepID=A0A1I1AYK1_9PSEU|nr:FAD-dependent monooxygenase [Amycolatopsis marina]SFB41343.1 pentachlorophenol monooxygenase/3-(3-hydroxy-phenyl)propionate hydroxylase [Amycolatopsis marina]
MDRRLNADRRVAVVGNGPVGQTTALLLARWGVPVVLLDARAARDTIGSKAICQQRDVLDVWESVGAGRRIADEGVTWTTARTFYRDEELFAYSLPDPGRSAFPPFVNVSQARTEEILDERIADQPLIDVRWGHRVTALDQRADGVVFSCATTAGSVDIEAAYAVACAGARGEDIRRMLGVGFAGQSFDDRFLICDIEADLPGWAHERRFYFDPRWNPGRQVLIHPCPESRFRIDWQVAGDFDLDEEEACGALDARIRAIVGELPYAIVWKTVYRFHSRLVDRMRVGRVLLAGDCAHLVSPFGARGLNSGVGDAENAAWKLAFVLHGWAGEELLESYHDERHAAAKENLDVTTATMEFLVPHDDKHRRRRVDVLTRAGTDPSVRSQVDSGRLAEPFWYVDSPLTTPDPSRPFAGRPPRGSVPAPAPGVLAPDVPVPIAGPTCRRFREIARDGFLLLAAPRVDLCAVRAAARRAGTGPIRVLELAGIDAGGALTEVLGAREDELWVLRPDAYVAAVLTAPGAAEVLHALRRAHGGSGPQVIRRTSPGRRRGAQAAVAAPEWG